MNMQEVWAIEQLASDVAKRASDFAARGSANFSGDTLAEELLYIALKIRGLERQTNQRPSLDGWPGQHL